MRKVRHSPYSYSLVCLIALLANSCGSISKGSFQTTPDSHFQNRVVTFETTEGTWMNIDVSPDGQHVVFDLLGDLYTLSISGGEAHSITMGMAWDQGPRFSPDGKFVYFISDRNGTENIWRVRLSDNRTEQVTDLCHRLSGSMNWRRSGAKIILGISENFIDSRLFEIDVNSGLPTPIDRQQEAIDECGGSVAGAIDGLIYSGVEARSGEIYYSEARVMVPASQRTVDIYRFDASNPIKQTLAPSTPFSDDFRPQISNDGYKLAFFRQYENARTELRVVDLESGETLQDWTLDTPAEAYLTRRGDSRPNYAFVPDDSAIVFWHGGKINRASLGDGSLETIPFRAKVERNLAPRLSPPIKQVKDIASARTIRWPNFSRDEQSLVFSAAGYIWSIELNTGELQKLTAENSFASWPTLSPDGNLIAYTAIEKKDGEFGPTRLMVLDRNLGEDRELARMLGGPRTEPFQALSWSPDGSKIAFLNSIGRKLEVGWVSVSGGDLNIIAEDSRLSVARAFQNTLFVGFNQTGEKIFYSFPAQLIGGQVVPMSVTEPILYSVDIRGGEPIKILSGGSEVRGLIPSPSGDRVIMTMNNYSVHVAPLTSNGVGGLDMATPHQVIPTTKSAAFFLRWNGDSKITFGLGRTVSLFDLHSKRLTSYEIDAKIEPPREIQTVIFRGATLIAVSDDAGAGPIIEDGALVVRGSRILEVGTSESVNAPDGAIIINAADKIIMPGMLDTHYHNLRGFGVGIGAIPDQAMANEVSLIYGITTAWDPGGLPDDASSAIADYFDAGRITGPRWSISAGSIGQTEELYFGDFEDFQSHFELRRMVGAEVVKEYSVSKRRDRQDMALAARESGLGIVSHLEAFDDMMALVTDGFTGGDHPGDGPYYYDVERFLADSGYIWTPNLNVDASNLDFSAIGVGNYRDVFRDFFSTLATNKPAELEKFIAVMERSPGRRLTASIKLVEPIIPYEIRRISRVARNVALLANGGVKIGVTGHEKPGFLLPMEMWHLWLGGMSVEDVLRAATMTNAEKIGWHEEVGSLEPGKLADFLILEQNPLDDILNVLSIEYTVQDGLLYDSDSGERVEARNLPRCKRPRDEIKVCRL